MASTIPLAGAITSPRFVVLRPKVLENSYVCYKDGRAVIDEEEGVFSPVVKIEVETASKVDGEKTFVHLMFYHSNRYMGRREGSEVPVAESKQPDEGTEKSTSTLFELRNVSSDPDKYYFCHIQSGTFPQLNEARDELVIKEWRVSDQDLMNFELVNWDTLVKLPKHVAFKGDNGRYLRARPFHNLPYLAFDSTDPNDGASGHEVELLRNGYVKIKCLYFSGHYWSNDHNWILADDSNASTTEKRLLFWPVYHGDDTISLLSAENNRFCQRLTADNKDDMLNAASETASAETRFVVQELVGDRQIYDVTYRMDDARVYGEKPFAAGTAVGENYTDKDNDSVSVSCNYEDVRSYSFSRSSSITAGVTAKIEANVMEITKESIEFSFEVTNTIEWGKTQEIKKSVTATGTVSVPAMSRAILNYVGTVGTCSIPYSYKQEDRSSTDGKITTTQQDDGVFTGVNAYNFTFQLQKYEPL